MPEIASSIPPLQWGDLSSFEKCPAAQNFFQLTLNITSTSGNQLLDELQHAVAARSTPYKDKFRQALYYLAERCFRIGDLAKTNLKFQHLYQDVENPPSIGSNIVNFLSFGIYKESHLPNCSFSVQTPLHRERYVVCQQYFNYFAENTVAAILFSCPNSAIDYNDLPFRVKNIGTYLVYAEDTHTQTLSSSINSWKIRDLWKQQMLENFCKTTTNEYWKNFHCSTDSKNDELSQNQSLTYWHQSIFPLAIETKDVYNSLIETQIHEEMESRQRIANTFIANAQQLLPNITTYFQEEAQALAQTRLNSQLTERVFAIKNELSELQRIYEGDKTLDNWEKLHTQASEANLFFIEQKLIQKHPDIYLFIDSLLTIFKPDVKEEL